MQYIMVFYWASLVRLKALCNNHLKAAPHRWRCSSFAKFLQKYQPTVETDLLLKGLQQYIAYHPKDE